MEKLVNKLAGFLTTPLQYDSEKRAVVQYGLFAIIQILIVAFIISLFGFLTGCIFECWIVYLTVVILRKSTGGAHASTSNGCLVVSVVVVSIIGFSSHYLYVLPHGFEIGLAICPITFLTGCFIIYKLAPVGSKNKPLKSPEKNKRLRRQSFITLIIYTFIALLLIIISFKRQSSLYLAVSLTVSVLWQAFTLLIAVIKKVDGFS